MVTAVKGAVKECAKDARPIPIPAQYATTIIESLRATPVKGALKLHVDPVTPGLISAPTVTLGMVLQQLTIPVCPALILTAFPAHGTTLFV